MESDNHYTEKHYRAFVSYSHSDRDAARWLHKALETYRIPGRLVGRPTSIGPIPARLGSIFIDREELSASGSLPDAVRSALAQSQFLIVICSPAAAKSVWVNKEIIEFKKVRGEAAILCLIVDGEPLVSNNPGGEETECFPPAVRFQVIPNGQLSDKPAEPIAADFRPQGDGRRMARLKMIAGLIDVGLDELVQRDVHRRNRRLFGVTVACLVGMLAMSVLTVVAFQARQDAEIARNEAQHRSAEAEDLIEFMLGELRSKLGPVGRLEVLDAVGQKALDYYAEMSASGLDDRSLARRARALQLLGEIQDLRGNLNVASQAFLESQQTTTALLERAPDDPQRIYDHAQSTFWVGFLDWRRGNQASAQVSLEAYLTLAERLTLIDPANADWQLELAFGHVNLGALLMERGDWPAAITTFSRAQIVMTGLTLRDAEQIDWLSALADTHSWLSSAYLEAGRLKDARDHRQQQLEIYRSILAKDANNLGANYDMVSAIRHHARLLLMSGEVQAALDEFSVAVQMVERRMHDDPENTGIAHLAGRIYLDHSDALLSTGMNTAAESALTRARKIGVRLLQVDASILKWKVELRCRERITQAQLDLAAGHLDDGLQHIRQATDELGTLRAAHQDNQSILLLLAHAHLVSGQLSQTSNRPDVARLSWQTAVDILAAVTSDLKPDARADLARAHHYLGNHQRARDLAGTLDQIGYRHPDFKALKGQLR